MIVLNEVKENKTNFIFYQNVRNFLSNMKKIASKKFYIKKKR